MELAATGIEIGSRRNFCHDARLDLSFRLSIGFAVMRAGRLDRRVAVQRFTAGTSPSGEPIEIWATMGGIARWASKTAVTGLERFGSEQLEAKEQIEFRLRWSADLADLQPKDRLIEPASDAGNSPVPERSTYDVIAVLEIGRHEGLRVLATRRP